ncbi:UNVERIFIED_CONTAM: hypothetical protein PYX00_002851 [Menopon gallinae]|uniref:dolichyl-P-Man:Man5GlcNAc2-PP-dolichol alpha-1,3-mannosyltransferase n=1 Tax=Menopon gallinae TaxID=328185 RepID=A0AAW2HYS0_9NEOP
MAPKSKTKKPSSFKFSDIGGFISKCFNYNFLRSLIMNPSKLFPVVCLLFFLEFVINILVIHRAKYTEIDWKAYMQEVEGVLNGTFDYSLLKGDTGPLVYPAGFVWIFSGLYYITNKGQSILTGQYVFAVFYLLNLLLVSRLYLKAKKVPPYVLILTCITSYRIHSIFVLRLFNDPVAMILLYAALNAFLDNKWTLGSFLYSLAVSVKMNILLFSPALLMAYLICLGLVETVKQLTICAAVQVVVALPFLLTHPVNYLMGAFNFGRVFLYQWTVNWRFLPEDVFVSKPFHIGLLVLHILLLAAFYKTSILYLKGYSQLKSVETDINDQCKKEQFNMSSLSQLFLLPLFLCNFIGVACSRSLHYQFYVWYFHTLPFLLWSTHYSVRIRLAILGLIEVCWNTYPSTNFSSSLLHICHIAILYGIYKYQREVLEPLSIMSKQKKST